MSKALVKAATDLPAVTLPDVASLSSPLLAQLTAALGVPRSVLAEDDQIDHAWSQLPRLIRKIASQKPSKAHIPPSLLDAGSAVWALGSGRRLTISRTTDGTTTTPVCWRSMT
jgi:hypothetical protein